jgi:membrane protein DedA with SNARE-associated domain
MIESFIAWMAGLPPVAIYCVIAVLAAVENIIPPFPADTIIALGAFLSHRGITNPWIVFAVTLSANMAGAMAMYWMAARHAPALLRSKLARWLLPEDALAFVRREYERFGVTGLFFGRFLPGFRAVVAPFAGLVHAGPIRAGLAMMFASAIWYGAIIYLASQLGERWGEILQQVGRINRGAGVVALIALAALALHLWRRQRRRRAHDG